MQNSSALNSLSKKLYKLLTFQFCRIMRMHENGLIDTWLKAGYPPSTQTTIKFQAKVIEFKDLQSAFYLIGIGVTSGVISWILERILHRSPKCNFRKTKGSVKLHRMQSFDLTAIQ